MTLKELGVLTKGLAPAIRDYVTGKVAPLESRLQELEQRLVALEAKPSVQDRGVWKSGEFYQPGDIVTRSGSAWICRASHVAVADEFDHNRFRLLVKKGRDGKDARS